MARLNVEFEEPAVGSYDRFEKDNFFTGLPENEISQDGMPLLIYLYSEMPDDASEMALVNATVLRDEKVAITSKMFHRVKMDGNRVDKSHPYWAVLKGKSLPRFVVTDPAGKRLSSVEGKVSPSGLYKIMKKASSKAYKNSPDKMVKQLQKVLTEIDKLEAKRSALATRRATSPDASKARLREWDKDEEELNEIEQDLLDQEAKILTLVLRSGEEITIA